MGPGIGGVLVELIGVNKENGRSLLGGGVEGVEGCFGALGLRALFVGGMITKTVVGCGNKKELKDRKQGFGVWHVTAFHALWAEKVVPTSTPCSYD